MSFTIIVGNESDDECVSTLIQLSHVAFATTPAPQVASECLQSERKDVEVITLELNH